MACSRKQRGERYKGRVPARVPFKSSPRGFLRNGGGKEEKARGSRGRGVDKLARRDRAHAGHEGERERALIIDCGTYSTRAESTQSIDCGTERE